MRNEFQLKTCPHCIPDLEHYGHRCQVCGGTGQICEYVDDGSAVVAWMFAAGLVAFFGLLLWAVAR
jgi:hypothetical protein